MRANFFPSAVAVSLLLTAVVTLGGCLSPPPSGESPAPSATPGVPAEWEASVEYQQAAQFDRYVRDALSDSERRSYRDQCRQDRSNPFCFSIKRANQLDDLIEDKARIARPGSAKPPTPFIPDIRRGKIRNWTKTRKAKVQSLLAGLSTATMDTLRILSTVALREKRCPNNAAIATAALMESYLAEHSLAPKIARLYEKGGNCARKRSYDREHFYTRAALFWVLAKHPGRAQRILAKVQPRDAFSGRALYWLARVRESIGDRKGALRAVRRLRAQHPFSFHALLSYAAEGLDPLDAFQKSYPGGAAGGEESGAIARVRSRRNAKVNAIADQIETLRKYNFDDSAAILVDWALYDFGTVEPEMRIWLASQGEPRTQVVQLQDLLLRKPSLRNQKMLQLAFPRAFFEILERQKSRVDPYLLLAVARKESVLNPSAISPANAQGLLQLNPMTAKKLRPGEKLDLLDAETNADLAARYLANLLQMMKGQLPLVIASYNAGEDPVLRWVRRYPTNDLLLFIDLIPYRETRDYVGFVMSNYYWYRRLYAADTEGPLRQLVGSQLAKTELPDGTRGVKSLDVDKLLESSDFAGDGGATDPAPRGPDTTMGPSAPVEVVAPSPDLAPLEPEPAVDERAPDAEEGADVADTTGEEPDAADAAATAEGKSP